MDIIIDPNKQFTRASSDRIMEACGIIPGFAWEAEEHAEAGRDAVHQAMEKCYGFPAPPSNTGASIDENGVYTYPDDPPLHPLMEIGLGHGVTVRIYQHAFVAISDAGGTIITRMD
jgi:hypothetical protein